MQKTPRFKGDFDKKPKIFEVENNRNNHGWKKENIMSRNGRTRNYEPINDKVKSYAQVIYNTEPKVSSDVNLKNERTMVLWKAKEKENPVFSHLHFNLGNA